MRSNRRRSLSGAAVGILAASFLLWLNHARREAHAEIATLKAQRLADQREIARLHAELAVARQLRSDATAMPPTGVNNVSRERAAAEDELDGWFERVDALRNFLIAHPEYAIPELDQASQLDWLDVTKSGKFLTEADFRKAAFRLRLAAKAKTSEALRQAIAAFQKAYPNAPLTSISQLTPNLPDGFNPAILARYLVATEMPPGWPKSLGLTAATSAVVEDVVDPLWDQQFLFGNNGVSTARVTGSDINRAVEKSIATYTAQHGSAPTDFAAVAPLLAPDIDPILAAELLQALGPR